MNDQLTPAVVLWFDSEKMKGMAADENATVYAFDSRNLSEQLKETGVWETHIVSLELNWRNGYGLARTVHCPTVEEFQEHGDALRRVYEQNLLTQELKRAENRGKGKFRYGR